MKFTSEAICVPGSSLKGFCFQFKCLIDKGLFGGFVVVSSSVCFDHLYFSKDLFIFTCQIYCHKVVHNTLLLSFHDCRLGSTWDISILLLLPSWEIKWWHINFKTRFWFYSPFSVLSPFLIPQFLELYLLSFSLYYVGFNLIFF